MADSTDMLAANQIIHQHGDGAEQYVSRQIRRLQQKSNPQGAGKWRAILRAIGEVRKLRQEVSRESKSNAAPLAGNPAGLAIFMGRRMKAVRLAEGLSQKELGKTLGVSAQQIQKYETGTDSIPLHRLVALASAYHLPLESFLGSQLSKSSDRVSDDGLDPGVIHLVRAYKRITNPRLRRHLLHLVKEMAGRGEEDGMPD
jgi:transcriptional regulator with XRE-family HTH domain